MEVYVDVYNTSSPVLNISLERLRNSYIRAILTDPIVDLSKICLLYTSDAADE